MLATNLRQEPISLMALAIPFIVGTGGAPFAGDAWATSEVDTAQTNADATDLALSAAK